MKKIRIIVKGSFLLILLVSFTLLYTSCKSTGKTQNSPESTVGNAHNSRNSLDWAGVYSAKLPCADCSGIDAIITLNSDGTYKRQYRYEGKSDSIYTETGKISWDKNGSIINLVAEGQPQNYKVIENGLQQLDGSGKPISGATASSYEFKKIEQNKIEEKYWKLTQLRGQNISFSGKKEPYMILKSADSSVRGFAGCNGFGGHFEHLPGNRIHFSKIISTMMACSDLALEKQFMQVLQTADNYSQHGDTLYLNKARMAPLAQFVAVYFN